MSVMMIAEVQGQTQQGYDGVLDKLAEAIRRAEGFIAHASHPVDGGWRVIELWQSKAQADRFYAGAVVPHLPPGIHPKRTTVELHSILTAESGAP